jgi:galactokinase
MSAETLFSERFGVPPSVVCSAPGRVNLIGEHTDYNGGFAMPITIAQRTTVAVATNGAGEVRAASEQFDDGAIKVFRKAEELGSFAAYVQGAHWVLEQAGHPVTPVDVALSSDVPIGSGLSSSAALLVATLRALRELFQLDVTDLDVATFAHRAEREFVGVPVGTMDPMACSLGKPEFALLLDTRALTYEQLPLPLDTELVIIDSAVRHQHVSGGYAKRREECEQAASLLGVEWLCDLTQPLERLATGLAWQRLDYVLQRRVSHVLSENERVFTAATAMRNHDPVTLGRCLNASHASLRDFFDVSTPEVDALVDALRREDACFGARMTGGGFGGAVVALVSRGSAWQVAQDAARRYVSQVPQYTPAIISPMSQDRLS